MSHLIKLLTQTFPMEIKVTMVGTIYCDSGSCIEEPKLCTQRKEPLKLTHND